MSLDFEGLYTQEYDRLCLYFRKRLSDPDDAPDFASAAFIRAWEHRHRYRPLPGIRPSSWLYCIARNLLIDHGRKHGKVSVVPLTTWDPFGEDAGSDEHIDRIDAQAALADAFARFRTGNPWQSPAKQLAVIQERYLVGGTDREVGARLGLTNKSVLQIRKRALANLKKTLEVA